jgi:hypothetical protein
VPHQAEHWAVELCFGDCKKKKCCIRLDDGAFDRILVHDGDWPGNPPRPYKEQSEDQIKQKKVIDPKGRIVIPPGKKYPVKLPIK